MDTLTPPWVAGSSPVPNANSEKRWSIPKSGSNRRSCSTVSSTGCTVPARLGSIATHARETTAMSSSIAAPFHTDSRSSINSAVPARPTFASRILMGSRSASSSQPRSANNLRACRSFRDPRATEKQVRINVRCSFRKAGSSQLLKGTELPSNAATTPSKRDRDLERIAISAGSSSPVVILN